MKIIELYKTQKKVLSLEIFPPKKDYPLTTIFNTLDELKLLNPSFISVTYGAGGSNRGRTVEIASRIKNEFHIEALAHLTSIGHSRAEVNALLDELQGNNIDNVLALRGDLPEGSAINLKNQDYTYAADLIRDIKIRSDFGIAAAAYPEGHPESSSLEEDLAHLKAKVEVGVDFLITQLFFDNALYYRFIERAGSLGIDCPIVPGIFPLLNINQVQKIKELSQASINPELLKQLEKYRHQPAEMEKTGIEYATRQTEDLLQNQVPGVHLYTMNKSGQIMEIVQNVGLA